VCERVYRRVLCLNRIAISLLPYRPYAEEETLDGLIAQGVWLPFIEVQRCVSKYPPGCTSRVGISRASTIGNCLEETSVHRTIVLYRTMHTLHARDQIG
jgi:hypothetical protein